MDVESPTSSVLSEADLGNITCDSDKENITPRHTMSTAEFRCQQNLLNNTSLFESNNASRVTSPPDPSPVEINPINSTTSQLNEYINRVTVTDSIDCEPQQRERVNSCSDISEISFDLKPEQRRFSESQIIYDKSVNLGNIHEEDDYAHIITPKKPTALSQDTQRRLTEITPESSTTPRDTSKFTPKLSTLKENKIMGTPDVTRRHPFDNSMMENFPIFSPGVFNDANNKSDTFKWSIEHISECNPAQFSVDQPSYILEEEKKAHEDTEYQSHVKSYFSQSRIAPSPLVGCKSFNPGGGGYSTISTQTNISLPIDFDLEALLEGKTVKKIPVKEPKIISDTSYRRQLFHREPELDDPHDQEDLLISPQELQHSPNIKSAPGTPLSEDASPSFLIGAPGFSTSNISVFSPIKDDNVVFRTPGPSNRKQVCTPSDSYHLMSTPAHLSVNAEDRMLQSTPAHISLDNLVMPAPTNKRKPEDTPEKGHSNFKRPRRVTFRLERPPLARRPMESSRIDSDVSSEGISPPILAPGIQALDIPLDISEIKHPDLTKLRTNNFLDISDISRKSTPCTSPALPPTKGEWSMISEDFKKNVNVNETANDSNKPTINSKDSGFSSVASKDSGFSSVASKDSGFSSVASSSNTLSNNHTLATHTATLSTLSEKGDLSEVDRDLEKDILLESRPGKRKQYPPEENISQGSSDDSGFCPPPVKRVLNVVEFGMTPAVEFENPQDLEVSGMAVEINDPGSSP